jgi:hypothetical protein
MPVSRRERICMWPISLVRPGVQPFNRTDLREYILKDGSRLFAELWETQSKDAVRGHVAKLRGAAVEPIDASSEAEMPVIRFGYAGHTFSIVAGTGEFRLIVADPNCDEDILMQVAGHFNELLRPTTTHSKLVGFRFRWPAFGYRPSDDRD